MRTKVWQAGWISSIRACSRTEQGSPGSLLGIFAQFDVPVGEVEEVFPAIVVLQADVQLNKRTPLRPLGLANKVHARFVRGAIGFEGVAVDARADNVFPIRWPAPVPRHDVVKVQVFALELLPAILAGVPVALENVVAGEFNFLFRQPIKQDEQDHTRDADAKGDGVNAFRVRLLLGKVMPLVEVISLKRAILGVEDDVRAAFKEKSKRTPGSANVNSLPQAIQH